MLFVRDGHYKECQIRITPYLRVSWKTFLALTFFFRCLLSLVSSFSSTFRCHFIGGSLFCIFLQHTVINYWEAADCSWFRCLGSVIYSGGFLRIEISMFSSKVTGFFDKFVAGIRKAIFGSTSEDPCTSIKRLFHLSLLDISIDIRAFLTLRPSQGTLILLGWWPHCHSHQIYINWIFFRCLKLQ